MDTLWKSLSVEAKEKLFNDCNGHETLYLHYCESTITIGNCHDITYKDGKYILTYDWEKVFSVEVEFGKIPDIIENIERY